MRFKGLRSVRIASLIVIPIMVAALSGAMPTVRAGRVVERTLAFVNTKPVLLSDVAFTQALLNLGEQEALQRTIEEIMMFDEASRLLDEPPVPEAVATAEQALRAKAGPGFSAKAVRRKALIQIAIARYIDVRLRPLVRVEDAEVRKLFNERQGEDSPPEAFSLAAVQIREVLERRALDQKVEEWVASLLRREEVRRR